ncbi:hypothetical protein BU204_27115 [Actinophytocola xanthii]|uniref:Novel STAND NTPase 1 domain-containing protein n=1 Tax=Actinophytocola xanthii TaxID=1912961 RepID=A0A1Q8CGJ8_9PSEU|nr:hypothetical protein BU204_27115 [Actinophytocola xanthii]
MNAETDLPDPDRVRTRQDFARELTLLRERSGMSVRQVASEIGAVGTHSTVGDWFAGRGLPSITSRDLLVRVLEVCDVADDGSIECWLRAWRRVRRAPGPRAKGVEPYRGLSSFQPEDADWFFGRETLIEELCVRLTGLHAAGRGIQLVVGASGSGKSSLLRAGLIPALRAGRLPGSASWPTVLCTPGAHPTGELATAVAGIGSPEGRQLVVVVDQFEEIFTAGADHDERRRFVTALEVAVADGALVVIGLRADFYAQALRYPQLITPAQAGQLAVGPMNEAELRAAIVAPANQAKIDIEEGLVELLLRDISPRGHPVSQEAHDAGVLPLLSHALYATWSHGAGRALTVAAYHEVGGIDGAVAASANKVYNDLSAPERELARELFLSLVHVAPDTADTRRRIAVAELLTGDDDTRLARGEHVLESFIAQRLITADLDTVEISHEALLTAWPQLRSWLDTDRAGLIVSRRLSEAATTWHREHRDTAALYRGTRLAAVQDWLETAPVVTHLTPLAREFLEASSQRERDEQRAVRRRTRRLRQLTVGLVVLLLIAVTTGVLAVRSQQRTREQRDSAISGKVANEATALRAVDPALAAQLSLAAHRLSPTPESHGSVLSSFATPYASRLTDHIRGVYAAEFSPTRHILATGALDNVVHLYDLANRHRPRLVNTLTGHTKGVTMAAFRSDGRILATAGDDGTARLWDVTDPRHARSTAVLTGHTLGVRRVAFSPDGQTLATASYDATVRLWDVSNPDQPHPVATLTAPEDAVGVVAFSPDGHTLATKATSTSIQLWDITDQTHPQPVRELTGHTDRLLCAVFSPDGRTLATGSFDDSVRLWDVTDPRHAGPLTTLPGHSNGVVAIAFSPDRRLMATGSYDNTVRLWDVTTPSAVSSPASFEGHADTVFTVAFSPDGSTLASGSNDNTVRLWEVHGHVLAGHTGPVNSVAVSPNGRILAVGGDRKTRLWHLAEASRPTPLGALDGHTDWVSWIAFGPGGRMIATASLDSTARLWDITDPMRPILLAVLIGHTHNVFSVAFSPGGRTLVTSSADETARLWDITDPRHPTEAATVTGHGAGIVSAVSSPDGTTLATAGFDHTTRLWDVRQPRHPAPLATLAGHTQTVIRATFSPDGHLLATAAADHTTRLWDVRQPRHPVLLATLTGHSNNVNDVVFSPDGHLLATAGDDHTIRMWDIRDPRQPGQPATLTGHADAVNAVAFTPGGTTIVTGGDDNTVRFWSTSIDTTAKRICDAAYPRITSTEWGRYFPDLPAQPPCR